MKDYNYYIPGYTGFCPTLPVHFGESYGKATRQVLRERPQDLLKERLSDVRYRRQQCRFPKDCGDNGQDHFSENPRYEKYKDNNRCRCINYLDERNMERHYKDGDENKIANRWTQRQSKGNDDRNCGESCRQQPPTHIVIDMGCAPGCCSNENERVYRPPAPPPPKPRPTQENIALHCYPILIADPLSNGQPCYQQQRGKSGQPRYQQQCERSGQSCCQPEYKRPEQSCCQPDRGWSGQSCCQPNRERSGQSCCQPDRERSGQSCCQPDRERSGQSCCGSERGSSRKSCCGGMGYKQDAFSHKRPLLMPVFRQCGVIPKYTGHITGMQFTLGESFGPASDRLLRRHHDKMKARNIYYR